jgi:hypothetical protein
MKRKLMLVFVGLAMLLASAVLGDMFTPSPMCSKPIKPYKFNSQFEFDNYQRQVTAYQECMSQFVEDQYKAAARHNAAAENAIEQWNRFAREQLN